MVDSVTCRDDHRGWSAAEECHGYRVVLVRRGRFRRMARGCATTVDPTFAYLAGPGEEERFAHPAGGDVCTSVHLSPSLWRQLTGDARPSRSTLYVDARLDLAHRLLLAADPADDLAERLLPLISAVVSQVAPDHSPVRDRSPDRALADAAREAILAGHPASGSLVPLAAHLRVSPYRLSRAFTREIGVSLTHYRNRVRVGRALDRLEQGDTGLAALAAELGFADQAHLTRTVRRHLGHTPTALRRLLARA